MFWARVLEFLLLPPSGLVFFGLAGLVLALTRWRRPGLWLAAICATALLLLSVPRVEGALFATLDRYPEPDFEAGGAGAIVILGAGVSTGHNGGALSRMGVERLEQGAGVYRRTGLPVLVSGASGELMARELERRSVPVRWIEGTSRNTHENAALSAAVLRRDGVARIYLVSHFWHLPRAAAAFRHAGAEVVPAPAGRELLADLQRGWKSWLPSRAGLDAGAVVFHEWGGRAWYRLRYGS